MNKQPLIKYGASTRAGLRTVGHTMAGMTGGLMGLSPAATGINPGSILPGSAYYAGRTAMQSAGFAAKAFGVGLSSFGSASVTGAKGYFSWRNQEASRLARARLLADKLESRGGVYTGGGILDQYGRQKDKITGKRQWRRFGARSPGEHLKKGLFNAVSPKHGLISPLSLGINLGLATYMSSDNIFDPYSGVGRHLASNIGAEVGALGGMSIGAALAAVAIPGSAIAAGIGLVGGMLLGAEAGGALADVPWKVSEFGHRMGTNARVRKSAFIDSEGAATMRQRALAAVSRSQMNARSAFGQEALSFHA